MKLESALLCLGALVMPHAAAAAPEWVERGTNLPRHDWAFDVGLGIAHAGRSPGDLTGLGMNLEGAVGITGGLELGLRTGFRFGSDGRALQADGYGRLFDRQTFGTNGDGVANPEVRLRGRLVHERVVDLALEGRAYLPIEDGSRFGMMFGVPIVLRLGGVVRLDTGVYVPVLFYSQTVFALSAPLDVWIQATPSLWLGPMTGVRLTSYGNQVVTSRFGDPPVVVGGDAHVTDVSLGFGLGYQFTHAFDLKTMVLFPGINHEAGARNFGAGVGIELRVE